MKALIDSDIWTDPNFEVLSMEAKLIVFWLWTAPGRDSAGVVRFSARRLCLTRGIGKWFVYLRLGWSWRCSLAWWLD